MTDQHPITLSTKLIQQWLGEYFGTTVTGEISDVEHALATRAARWGADQELEACCEWLNFYAAAVDAQDLRTARRPKPKSLAEEAQKALAHLLRHSSTELGSETIRRALKRLQELERQE